MIIKENINKTCCKCGKNKSLPHWYRYYENDIFINKYVCATCYTRIKYPRPRLNKPKKICKICGSDKTVGNWYRHTVSKEYPICKSCYNRHDPGSYNGTIKLMCKCRNKQLGKDTTKGKGFRAEQGILYTLGLENCNIKENNFSHIIDGYQKNGDGRIQIKSSSLAAGDGINDYEWIFGSININNCDTVYLACMNVTYSKYLKIFRIPVDYIKTIDIRYIKINPNTVKKWNWNKYEIDVDIFNNKYQNLSIDNCNILKDD